MAATPTLSRCWRAALKQILTSAAEPGVRAALVGMGHELRGDDAAGLWVARRWRSIAPSRWLVLDAGPAPENFTGTLRRFAPDVILLVDAVEMGLPPGAVRLLELNHAESRSASTHTLSCHLLAAYLLAQRPCTIRLLGIQAGQDRLGAGLSPAAAAAVRRIIAALRHSMV
jgi:hydrogenase maturation protease HycI